MLIVVNNKLQSREGDKFFLQKTGTHKAEAVQWRIRSEETEYNPALE